VLKTLTYQRTITAEVCSIGLWLRAHADVGRICVLAWLFTVSGWGSEGGLLGGQPVAEGATWGFTQ